MTGTLRETFQSPYQQYADRIGQKFSLVRTITEQDENHDQEVLPIHVIEFDDGIQIEAWPEEIEADYTW